MLGFLPRLYEDELLYSWLARYHLYSLNEGPKQTMKELFNDVCQLAVPDLPIRLGDLYEQAQHFMPNSLERWINKHTFYHYYTNFALPETKKTVGSIMITGCRKGAIHTMAGVMASQVKDNSNFMYCPLCVQEDLQNYGETYWRLSHQLPSVMVCVKHACILQKSNIPFRPRNRHEFVPAMKESCTILTPIHEQRYSDKTMEHLLAIAYDSIHLATNDYLFDWGTLQRVYRYSLQTKGLANVKGIVRQQTLAEQFQAFYGTEVLSLLQSRVDIHNDSCWLKAITRKYRKAFHPVRHLLLIRFLGECLETLLSYVKEEYLPFGQAPYPCLNRACSSYSKDVILKVIVSICTDTRNPVGTFTCSLCGFSYSRRGPDTTANDRYKIGRIKNFGTVWKSKLNQLVNVEEKSFRATARELGVDTQTVIKYASKKKKDLVSKQVDDSKSQADKEAWLAIQLAHPTWSVTQLREKNQALYARLYRCCRDWLQDNSPSIKRKQALNSIINWHERDREVLHQVQEVVEQMLKQSPPIRITLSRIGTITRQRNLLEKHLDKIPRTKAFLTTVLESTEQFQIRRIRFVAIELCKEGELPEWRLKRLAGLRSNISKVVQIEIRQLVEQSYMERDYNGKCED